MALIYHKVRQMLSGIPLSVPVLLTVLCSLMALLLELQWLLNFHVSVFFSVSCPTYLENAFSPIDTEVTQLTSGEGMLLTLLSSPIPSRDICKIYSDFREAKNLSLISSHDKKKFP